jgi:flagellar basal body-associated protein FliL
MSQADASAVKPNAGRRRGPWFLVAIGLFLVLAAAAGGGAWYFYLSDPALHLSEKPPADDHPLPSYLEIKPIVVSMVNTEGVLHYVQLGLNLTLSDAAASEMVTAVMPEIQDVIRQTLLGFKVDDVATAAGIDNVRGALLANVNQVLAQRLGVERIRRLKGGEGKNGVVQRIHFSTLVVE